jgi:excisionase family DNA binding protein
MSIQKRWYTAQEAAGYIGCDKKTLIRFSVNGWLKKVKILNLVRFRKRDLDYFLKYQQERAP